MATGAGHGGSPRRLIATGNQRLLSAGIARDEASLEARLLAQHALGWDAARLFMDIDAPLAQDAAAAYDRLIARREKREPLAYIVGLREFWGLEIAVTPAVLVPRPETEFIIEALLAALPAGSPARILDLCTGSGCVAVAIAVERPAWSVTATDISASALEVARRNAERHGVERRVEFGQGDLFAPVAGRFDAIVANPPYVPSGDRDGLAPEVRDFEPELALFAGADGLDIVRRLTRDAANYLVSDGLLLFEIGRGQDETVAGLISHAPGLRMERFVRDLQGIPRIAVARRTAP